MQKSYQKLLDGNTLHKENNFIDFNIERLIPKMLSCDGPKMAIADMANDDAEYYADAALERFDKKFPPPAPQPETHFTNTHNPSA